MERTPKAGRLSSEFAKAKRAEAVGFVFLVVGMALALLSALQANGTGMVGVGLAAVGAYLVGHTSAAYSTARAQVKASASLPPTTVVSPSVRVGSGRL